MKKSILYILYILSLLSLSACENQDPSMSDQSMPIVVEGWIENGVSPVVMVTHAVNLTADSVSFDNFVEKWCRVSVYDGDTRYLLTGTVNKDYTPSFIFTSSSLKGKTGHAYRLLIEFEARTIQSTSTNRLRWKTTILYSPSGHLSAALIRKGITRYLSNRGKRTPDITVLFSEPFPAMNMMTLKG